MNEAVEISETVALEIDAASLPAAHPDKADS